MLTGTLPPLSRLGEQSITINLVDDDDGQPIDGTLYDFQISITGVNGERGFTIGSTDDAISSGSGFLTIKLSNAQTGSLCRGTYRIDVLMSLDGETAHIASLLTQAEYGSYAARPIPTSVTPDTGTITVTVDGGEI